LNLVSEVGGGRKDSDKDREIKQLRKELSQSKTGTGNNAENKVLRQKVKDLEQENRQLRTRLSKTGNGATPGGKAPMSAQRTRPRNSTASSVAGGTTNAAIGRT